MLKALDGVLTKAETYAKEKGLPESALLDAKLIDDMFPMKKQVQVATDNAKGAAARLGGLEVPVFADDEQSFADLHARIAKTLAFLDTVKEESFADAANRRITLPYFPGKYMTGEGYAYEYVLPNFFFHITTAYAILRKEGVPVGKADYMGGLPLIDEAS